MTLVSVILVKKTCKSQIFVAGKVLKSHANYLTNTFSHKLLKIS